MISQFKSESKNILYHSSTALAVALEEIKSGEKVLKLSGLKGSSKFYVITELLKATGRHVLYILPSRESAESAADDISFYIGEKPPILLRKELNTKEAIFSSELTKTQDRISWLYSAREKEILLAESSALFERLVPTDVFEGSLIHLQNGSHVSRDDFISTITNIGYVRSDFVEKTGEISIRGAIVDLFSPGTSQPLRIEFSGDEIGSIRHFSIDDQKSTGMIERATILPPSEVILNEETIEKSLSYIRRKAAYLEASGSAKRALLEKIEKGNRFPEIEWLISSFYTKLSTIFDYIPQNSLIVFDSPDEIAKSSETFTHSLSDTQSLLEKRLKIHPDVQELYITQDELDDELSRFQRVLIEDIEISEEGAKRISFNTEGVSVHKKDGLDSPFEILSEKIQEWQSLDLSVHIVLQTELEKKKVREILSERGIKNFETHVGALSEGFVFPEAGFVIVTERDIFGEKKKSKQKPARDIPSAFITSFSELKPGDYIVHRDFGIGIFRGLKRLKIEKTEGDFLLCEYQGGDKIYVPVENLKLVQSYIGDGKSPRIDKLGHENWKKVIKRVKRAVENIARELLQLYAERKAERGFQFSKRDNLFREFEIAFPYEETQDQSAAIEEVIGDMELPKPMDRLICGDVGFGKTEVAIRAAFKAVMDGKQAALLVPTTLLAYQHYITSTERLKSYPVSIDMLSRFRTGKEEKEILNKLETGTIDIVIGTHKLLGEKVKFKDLGLVIIDEEQRFGVKHKEKLRSLKKGVDVLTLSATPIPRTLQLSLSGIRDISLINTPPEGRQAVETYVYQFSKAVIQEAISKELERGGSVFFIHNRIEDIFRAADLIKELAPEARIDVTHGRMREATLEKSITKFIEGRTDVLVTTAIVESGLDIPRANTIIVNDSHTFGLADLYQLRGRVGRSEKKAYAYFLIPGRSSLSTDAKRRLRAVLELKELGSGFKLALSDLEIRGAGNLFGAEQSGHIADVGLELYLDLLHKAVEELSNGETTVLYEPEIKTNLPAFLPDDYIEDERERLLFYKRLSSAASKRELNEIERELTDRFGSLPESVSNLIQVVGLKTLMRELLIGRMEIGDGETVIIFLGGSPLFSRFRPSGKLKILHEKKDAIDEIKKKLERMQRGKP